MANQYKSKKDGEEKQGKRPDYVVRARQEPGSEFFINCGAAWVVDVNGRKGISLKLTALPVQTDGSFLLLEPKDE